MLILVLVARTHVLISARVVEFVHHPVLAPVPMVVVVVVSSVQVVQ